nr:F-box protein CPR30 [Ipomoea batatas]
MALDLHYKLLAFGTDILGSCHGLLCLDTTGDEDRMVLWNPTTQKYTSVFPSRSLKTCGNRPFVSGTSEAKVYSLKSNSWRKIRLSGKPLEFVTPLAFSKSGREVFMVVNVALLSRGHESLLCGMVSTATNCPSELLGLRLFSVPIMESMDSCNSGLNIRVSKIQIVLGVGMELLLLLGISATSYKEEKEIKRKF